MADLTGFDPAQYPEVSMNREPIPPGTYVGVITNTQMRTSHAKNDYLEIEFEITDGPHARRRIWDRLHLWHPKEEVVEIGKRRLASACRALGIKAPQDSTELHDRPIAMIVTTKIRKDTQERVNECNGYAAVTDTATKPVLGRTSGSIRSGVANALAGKASKAPAVPAGVAGQDDIPF